jgi:hypothetical protein
MATFSDIPEVVIDYVRGVFAAANEKSARALSAHPNMYEETLGHILVMELTAYPSAFFAQRWVSVMIESHWLGSRWMWGRWEIADIAIFVVRREWASYDSGRSPCCRRSGSDPVGDPRDADPIVGESGELWFVGRKKDIIIRGGSNITPLEVELVLRRHPLVRDAAVFGVPDPVLGQRVAAVAQLSSGLGDATLGHILRDTRQQLADYKVPSCGIFSRGSRPVEPQCTAQTHARGPMARTSRTMRVTAAPPMPASRTIARHSRPIAHGCRVQITRRVTAHGCKPPGASFFLNAVILVVKRKRCCHARHELGKTAWNLYTSK